MMNKVVSRQNRPASLLLTILIGLIAIHQVAQAAPRTSRVAPKTEKQRVKALGTNANFRKSLSILFSLAQKEAISLNKMDKGLKEKYISSLKKYRQQVKQSGNQSVQLPAIVRANATYDKDLANQLLLSQKKLQKDFPEPPTAAETGQAATDYNYSSGGIEYGFSNIDETYCDRVDCVCTKACDEEYRQAYNRAGYEWFTDAVKGMQPFNMFFGWTKMAIKIHELQVIRLDCMEQCDGIDYEGRCFDDSDCSSEEFCHSAFGNPYKSCWGKKEEGRTCSRHAKCSSGCCKYHVGSHPFSKVCRPSNKCN